ncbi:response regulator [Candidatus Poribacteria bacterium]|nr:response regulator [Candidatus Poribacteria bacterium]
MSHKAKILAVDDDNHLLNGMLRILKNAGHEVLGAKNGQGCMKILEEYEPDLILLDVILPDEDGFELCKQIKSAPRFSETYVILLSSLRTSSEAQANGLEIGADGYIARPISNKELLARVDAMLRLKAAQTEVKIRSQQNEAIAESGQLALSGTDIPTLTRHIIELISQTMKAEYLGFFKFIKHKSVFSLEYGMGWESDNLEINIDEAKGKGYDFLLYTPLSFNFGDNILHNMDIPDPFAEYDISSGVNIVVKDHAKIYGILGLYYTQKREFTRNDLNFLQSVANVLASAIERKQMEDEILDERERLAVTLRSIGDGVIATDLDCKVVLMNGIAEKLTGWKTEEAVGKELDDIFHIKSENQRDVCDNPVYEVIETGKIVNVFENTILISKDGTERIVADSGAPIFHNDGSLVGVVLVFRDVTEKLKLEKEIQKVERLESIGVLAGGIAHDFNNYLAGILGNISLASYYIESNKSTEKALDRLTKAERASISAQSLTKRLLTFSKGGLPIKQNIYINDLLEESVNLALSGSNVSPVYYLTDDIWSIEADPGQIQQVMSNLTINAKQAMPDGGIFKVFTENIELKGDHDLPLENDRYIKISLQDEGIGIPEQYIDKIFEPYFTTKQTGSGLGLAVCYSIIKNHKGYMEVESQVNKGTTFNIYLPATEIV